MPQLLIVTNDTDKFSEIVKQLSTESKCQIHWANSVNAARIAITEAPVDLLIIDEAVDGTAGFDIARDVISVNAMINLALVSPLSPQDFHAAGEGLGIMVQLSPSPGKEDADKLLAAFKTISALKPPA
jgi:DNA-binding response OmpR family regulator